MAIASATSLKTNQTNWKTSHLFSLLDPEILQRSDPLLGGHKNNRLQSTAMRTCTVATPRLSDDGQLKSDDPPEHSSATASERVLFAWAWMDHFIPPVANPCIS
jgi:hypothetical protein